MNVTDKRFNQVIVMTVILILAPNQESLQNYDSYKNRSPHKCQVLEKFREELELRYEEINAHLVSTNTARGVL